MKKYMVVLLVLVAVAALTGTASAKARGYGLVFGGRDHATTGGVPELLLPAGAVR